MLLGALIPMTVCLSQLFSSLSDTLFSTMKTNSSSLKDDSVSPQTTEYRVKNCFNSIMMIVATIMPSLIPVDQLQWIITGPVYSATSNSTSNLVPHVLGTNHQHRPQLAFSTFSQYQKTDYRDPLLILVNQRGKNKIRY